MNVDAESVESVPLSFDTKTSTPPLCVISYAPVVVGKLVVVVVVSPVTYTLPELSLAIEYP